MKTPYSKLSIERLESAVNNHTKSLKIAKKKYKIEVARIKDTYPKELGYDYAIKQENKKLYLAEWRLKTAKKWLQKRIDERDMKNH